MHAGFEVKNGRSVPVIEGVVVLQRDEAALLDAYMVRPEEASCGWGWKNYKSFVSGWGWRNDGCCQPSHNPSFIYITPGLRRAEGGEGGFGAREEGGWYGRSVFVWGGLTCCWTLDERRSLPPGLVMYVR